MADWASTWSRISAGVNAIATQRSNLTVGGASYLSEESGLLADSAALDGDLDQVAKQRLVAARSRFSNAIAQAYRDVIDPCLLQLSRVMGKPQTNPGAVLPILYDYMALNQGSLHTAPVLSSRNFTRGSWTAAGGNVGNGTIVRLNVDQYGLPLESGYAEVKTFQILADYQSGTNPGQEQFAVYGQPFRDALQRYQSGYGSGINAPAGTLTGITGDTTQALLLNPSFSDFSGTNATSSFALAQWTLSSGTAASMSVDTTNFYRACAIEGTPGALKVTGSVTLTQTLSTRAGSLASTLPYLWQFACRRDLSGGGTGTITLQIGSNASATVTLAAQTGWVLVQPTIDKNLYFYNFNTNSLTATLTLTVTSGTLFVDDVLWAPFVNVDGTYFAAVGGSTNWRYYDSGTVTDTEGNTSAFVQRAFSEGYGWSLPSQVKPNPAIGISFAVAAGGAGTITQGVHAFAVTYVTATGESDVTASTLQFFSFSGTTTASLSLIPTGPGGTLKRRIYMTHAFGRIATSRAMPWYYVAELNDNTTTIATIDGADSTILTAMAPVTDAPVLIA